MRDLVEKLSSSMTYKSDFVLVIFGEQESRKND